MIDAFLRGLLDPWLINSIYVVARSAESLSRTNPELIDARVSLLNIDITQTDYLPSADYVIHAAASTDAARYLFRPLKERANIQAATYNYCRLAPKLHASSKILYTSSGAVYGQQSSDSPFLRETDSSTDYDSFPLQKRDYAAAKWDAESAICKLGADGLNVSVARCFAFVGPYLPRDQHGWVIWKVH